MSLLLELCYRRSNYKGETGPTEVYSSLGWILSGQVVGSASTLVTHIAMAEAKSIQSKGSIEKFLGA